MLVLSRSPGETIHIGDDIVVEIIQSNDKKVCVGITAPKNMTILRGELFPKYASSAPASAVALPCDHAVLLKNTERILATVNRIEEVLQRR